MQFQVSRTRANDAVPVDMGRSFVAETAQGPVVIFLDATGAIAGDIDIAPLRILDGEWWSAPPAH